MVEGYIRFVLRHRLLVLLAVAALTGVAGWSVSRGVIASSMIKLFFGENPDYARYRTLAERFADSEPTIMAVQATDLFTPEGWQRHSAIARELAELDWVERVDSVFSSSRVRAEGDVLEVSSWDDVASNTEDWAGLRRTLCTDELVGGLLISDDGLAVSYLVEAVPDDARPVEAFPAFLDSAYTVFERAGYRRSDVHAAGIAPETVEGTNQARFSMFRIFPITVLVLVFAVFLLFNRVWPVMITTGVAFLSIAWAFGIAVAIDREINLMLATVPAVMMIVAFSDIIHLCSSYLLELANGRDKRDAIIKSGSEVGLACFFTSATTFVGFLALAFVPTPVFRLLGTVLGAGVAIALLLAMTLVPIFFFYMPTPQAVDLSQQAFAGRAVAALVEQCRRLALSRPVSVVVFFALVAVFSVVGAARITVETSIIERLQPDNPTRISQQFISDRFAGTNILDVYVLVEQGDLLDQSRYAGMQSLQEQVARMQDVDRVQSVVTLIDLLHRELSGRNESAPPGNRALLSQYLLLFEMSGGENLEQLIDTERQALRMIVRVPHTGMVGTSKLGERIEQAGAELFDDGVEVFPAGMTALFGDWIQFIMVGQRRGLIFALISTTLMMMVGLRLVGAGLISMIPNALPLLVLGGYLGWSWQTVDSDTVIVAMIAIGIAVDDTVHFLTRFRIESARTSSVDIALERTFAFSGRPIIQTTIILWAGFTPFVTSDYFSTRIMGTLLPMTLVTALIADLLLLPALVKLGILRMPMAAAGSEPAGPDDAVALLDGR